ncbi:hypothetical protein HNY73_019207 [Argiope bruennichi]|uniref:Uncharacterized protein n=1 Tax=Argiope bruennichi TaxID=94029 RepID=A0A8T0EGJ6_ARGBR|nr:hypothetical protein HNY73_019207 [Argiope bruennichi]
MKSETTSLLLLRGHLPRGSKYRPIVSAEGVKRKKRPKRVDSNEIRDHKPPSSERPFAERKAIVKARSGCQK